MNYIFNIKIGPDWIWATGELRPLYVRVYSDLHQYLILIITLMSKYTHSVPIKCPKHGFNFFNNTRISTKSNKIYL